MLCFHCMPPGSLHVLGAFVSFHRAISHLKWYKIICTRCLAYTFSQMKSINRAKNIYGVWVISTTSTVGLAKPVKVEYGWVITSHKFMQTWWYIHALNAMWFYGELIISLNEISIRGSSSARIHWKNIAKSAQEQWIQFHWGIYVLANFLFDKKGNAEFRNFVLCGFFLMWKGFLWISSEMNLGLILPRSFSSQFKFDEKFVLFSARFRQSDRYTLQWRHNGQSDRHTLQWRHNGHGSVSNHQPHDCLFNRLFRRRSKKTSKLRVTGLCAGNSPGTGEFPAQMASYAENVSIWWRYHGDRVYGVTAELSRHVQKFVAICRTTGGHFY